MSDTSSIAVRLVSSEPAGLLTTPLGVPVLRLEGVDDRPCDNASPLEPLSGPPPFTCPLLLPIGTPMPLP